MDIKKHSKTSDALTEVSELFPTMQFRFKLKEVMADRGLVLRDVVELTGIGLSTLSDMSNLRRSSINVLHILTICKALRISDISELFELVAEEPDLKKLTIEGEMFKEMGRLPTEEDIAEMDIFTKRYE